jgi:hypothetical protein
VGLERVLVRIEDGGPSTLTDAKGAFRLAGVKPGRRKLYVSLIGYALARRDVEVPADGLELTIPLAEGTGTYTESVTVAADRFAPAEAAVVSQQVLGSADLQNLRGVLADDPMRAIQVLPGVASTDDLRSEFTVRASAFANVNMTVDGFATPNILHTVRAVEDYSSSGSVAMINSDVLQDVALLSGSYPQRFGNKTGAEVDFRLRDGSRDRTQARLALSGTNASAVVEGPLGRAKRGSWLLSARQSYLDLIINQLDIDQDLKFGFTDAQAKFAFDVSPSNRLDLTLIGGRSRGEERSGDIDADERFVGRNRSAVAIAGWRAATGKSILTVRALAAANEFDNTDTGDVVIDDGYDRQAGVRADASLPRWRHIDLDIGFNAEWTREHRTRQRFTFGQYRPINNFTGDALRLGAYAQSRLHAGRFTFAPGVRADRTDLTGDATVSPWAQIEVRLPHAFAVRLGSGVYQQFPSLEHVLGNLAVPDAHPMRAEHYDVGIEHRLTASTRWQVALYHREEEGFFRRPLAEHRLAKGTLVRGVRSAPFEQSLEGYARGVEFLVQRKSASGLSGWLSYAYGHHRYTDVVRHESFYSDNDQRHAFNIYGIYRMSERFSLSAKARFGSNTPAPGYFREVDGSYTLSTQRNEVRLPSYSRVDLRANRTFNWSARRLTLFAEVINVFNRDNVRFIPPSVSSSTLRVSRMFEQMAPLLPSVGVLFEF